MNEKQGTFVPYIIISVLLALAFGVIGFLVSKDSIKDDTSLRGVNITHEYYATSTLKMSGVEVKASRFDQVIATTTSHHFSVTLGSVIIASSTAKWMEIWDATSTAAMTEGTYPILITRIATSTTEGVLPFDISLTYGLVVRLPENFAGDYVITWRR